MAVENDYNLLVDNLNELAKTISDLRDEVERRRVREARERLEPNETDWVNAIALNLDFVEYVFDGLPVGAVRVLESDPGEPVFPAQPPELPDSP